MPTHKIHSKYAGIGNDVLQTNRISLKAKGLLGYLVSKPEGWDFNGDRISREIKEGRDSVYNTLKELERDGLIEREKQADGRVIYHIYSSYELLEVANDGLAKLGKSQVGKTRSISNPSFKEKKRERTTSYNSHTLKLGKEDVNDLLTEHRITEKSLNKVGKKYRNWCDDKNKPLSLAGFKLFLTRERWDIEDFTPDKQIEMQIRGEI
jgi:predicted transcriptional regulator